MAKRPAKGQRVRRALTIVSFLLLPVTLNYLSPYVIVDGASQGIINGSFISFALMFLSALFLGRLWCGWVCPECTANCPMSLDVNGMVQRGDMENSECILCGSCVDICPQDVIRYSFSRGKQAQVTPGQPGIHAQSVPAVAETALRTARTCRGLPEGVRAGPDRGPEASRGHVRRSDGFRISPSSAGA